MSLLADTSGLKGGQRPVGGGAVAALALRLAAPDRQGLIILLWIAGNLLDATSTWIGLQMGLVEANPLPQALLYGLGPAAFWGTKAVLTLALPFLVAYLARSRHPVIWAAQTLCTASVGLIVVWNCTLIGLMALTGAL